MDKSKKGLDIDALKKKYGKLAIKSPAKTIKKVVKVKPKPNKE